MKKTPDNIDHRIQLKHDEIRRYLDCIKNYDTINMKKYGRPYLSRLEDQLYDLLEEKRNLENKTSI